MKKLLLSFILILCIVTPTSAIVVRSIMGGALDGPIPSNSLELVQSFELPNLRVVSDFVLVSGNFYVLGQITGTTLRISKITQSTLTHVSTLSFLTSRAQDRLPRLHYNGNNHLITNEGQQAIRTATITPFATDVLLNFNQAGSTIAGIFSTLVVGDTLHMLKRDLSSTFTRTTFMNTISTPVDPLLSNDVVVENADLPYSTMTHTLPIFAGRSVVAGASIINNLTTTLQVTPVISDWIDSPTTLISDGTNLYVGGIAGVMSKVTISPFAETDVITVGSGFSGASAELIVGNKLYVGSVSGRITRISIPGFTVDKVVDYGFGEIGSILRDSSDGTIWVIADNTVVSKIFQIAP